MSNSLRRITNRQLFSSSASFHSHPHRASKCCPLGGSNSELQLHFSIPHIRTGCQCQQMTTIIIRVMFVYYYISGLIVNLRTCRFSIYSQHRWQQHEFSPPSPTFAITVLWKTQGNLKIIKVTKLDMNIIEFLRNDSKQAV